MALNRRINRLIKMIIKLERGKWLSTDGGVSWVRRRAKVFLLRETASLDWGEPLVFPHTSNSWDAWITCCHSYSCHRKCSWHVSCPVRGRLRTGYDIMLGRRRVPSILVSAVLRPVIRPAWQRLNHESTGFKYAVLVICSKESGQSVKE